MRDNAKCAGAGCSIREGCDRFVRPAVDRQEWVEPDWTMGVVIVDGERFWTARCSNHRPLRVQPHGGASEEGDQC